MDQGKIPGKVGALPTLGANHNFVVAWDGLEERFCKILAMWKRQYTFEGKRLTWFNSALATLCICFVC